MYSSLDVEINKQVKIDAVCWYFLDGVFDDSLGVYFFQIKKMQLMLRVNIPLDMHDFILWQCMISPSQCMTFP